MYFGYGGDSIILWSFIKSIFLLCESKPHLFKVFFRKRSHNWVLLKTFLKIIVVMEFALRPVNLMRAISLLFFLCCKDNFLIRNCVLYSIMMMHRHSVCPQMMMLAKVLQERRQNHVQNLSIPAKANLCPVMMELEENEHWQMAEKKQKAGYFQCKDSWEIPESQSSVSSEPKFSF